MSLLTNVRRLWPALLFITVLGAAVYALASGAVSVLSPDQQGYRDYEQDDYAEAANSFVDPMWQGVALFKQGEFDQAAGVFAGSGTADSAYNQGNALLMQGKYEEAAGAYSRALELRPEWNDAVNNREIALGRAARLKQEGGDMTGGMLGADDIVFTTGESPPSDGEEQTDGGQVLGDKEIRAMWLRQVQTKPADFLASKFAYQLAMRPPPEIEKSNSGE
jgi:Ca-activated chloride channel family protein